MPLVTIKYEPEAFPFEPGEDSSLVPAIVWSIAQNLPVLFADIPEMFGLRKGLPDEATQVEVLCFGNTVNGPDLWVHVQFTETPPNIDTRNRVRDAVWDEIMFTFRLHLPPDCTRRQSVALDMFWGPGHGIIDIPMRSRPSDKPLFITW